MAEGAELQVADDQLQGLEPMGIQPMQPENLGLYAPFEISPEPMFSRDELGEDLTVAIKNMATGGGLYEEAARIWELMQASEARLFDRGYQWLTPSNQGNGWGIAGAQKLNGSGAMSNMDAKRMWAINIYGARKDKIVSALTVKDPEPEFFPKRPDSAIDQRAAEESTKYKHLWKQATNVRGLCNKTGGLFYTDDRVALITESVADAQRFGMEDSEPGIGEVTKAYGKLEIRVPMSVDEDDPLPWLSRSRELDLAVAKEKFPWIASTMSGGSGVDGSIARTCRLTVRNAVAGQVGLTGNAADRAVTETTIWVRPAQYRDVVDDEQRKTLRGMFPAGMRIVFAGEQFAYCRNEKMDDCVVLLYSREGTGQNRRAIGTNNLTTQKVLNYDYTLFNRYMTSCVPRKIHDPERIQSEAINQQRADPAYSMPVKVDSGQTLEGAVGVEAVPSPPAQLLDFIQLHVEGLPDALDGASPSMFGGTDGTDTATGITVQRDQALQVFGTPYNAMTWGIAKACQMAARWAGKNRTGTVSGMVPGAGRVSVDMEALAGDTYCFPEADSGYPESEAEKEQRLLTAIDSSANLPSLAQALNSAINFAAVEKVTKRFGVRIPGANSVRKQQSEFEAILANEPQPNPAFVQASLQIQELVEQAQGNPEAQTPEGQQVMQQAQAQLQQIPQLVCSVPVEQDASVNHSVEADICFDKINSEEGQKLKREKPPIFENLMLHWQGHVEMAEKLNPPAAPEVRESISIPLDKMSPEVQAQILSQKYGLQVTAEQTDTTGVHEIKQEKEGMDADGVPVKQVVSYSGKPLN